MKARTGELEVLTLCENFWMGIGKTVPRITWVFLPAQRNPRKAWERLTESHPEVVTKCDHLQFPGPGQRDTPVAKTKEDAYYILGLLPGAVGDVRLNLGFRRFHRPLPRRRFGDPPPVNLHPPLALNN